MPTASATPPIFAQVLSEAYEVFACPAPSNLNVCTKCCMDLADHDAMLACHPSQIEEKHLISWFNAAFVLSEFPQSVRTFLAPRIMAFAAGTNDYIHHELMFERLRLGDAQLWSDAQNDVIRAYHRTYFDWYRRRSEDDPFLDDILCTFSLTHFPAEDGIDCLNRWRDEELFDRLWLDSQHAGGATLWQSVWWDWDPGGMHPSIAEAKRQIDAWYYGPVLRGRIDRFLETADPTTNRWSRAAELEVALARGR
ncbi:hypothetical protein AB2B41_02475 [Marimonas sp. MJW-29]|uniref:Uncharacterized protein n=1 Tax=Sulfitobacter sediminis TaxID=3234186 RepID=A0ABV3RHK9_9RHOB